MVPADARETIRSLARGGYFRRWLEPVDCVDGPEICRAVWQKYGQVDLESDDLSEDVVELVWEWLPRGNIANTPAEMLEIFRTRESADRTGRSMFLSAWDDPRCRTLPRKERYKTAVWLSETRFRHLPLAEQIAYMAQRYGVHCAIDPTEWVCTDVDGTYERRER